MRFWVLQIAVSTVSFALAVPTPEEPSFKPDRQEVESGDTATLSWQWKVATRGYLSSSGLLEHPSGGLLKVSPKETTSYVLILEAPGLVPKVLTQSIVVLGSKGRSGDWPEDLLAPLAYQADYAISSLPLTALAARVRSVLQDERGFEVRQFSPAEDEIVFSTGFLQDAKLNDPSESPRRLRRIAFRVALSAGKSDSIHVNLSSSIQWRIAVDDRWFPESSSSSDWYKKQTGDLWRSLKAN